MPSDRKFTIRFVSAIQLIARGWKCRRYLCLLLVIAAGSLVGCSRKPTVPWGTAEGKVAVDGQPVNQGTVIFENRELGVSRMAELQPDGSFVQKSIDFPGLPAGKYRVAISPLGISKGDWVPVTKAVPGVVVTPIPEQYRTVEKSDLTAEVKEGKNPPFVFDLKK